MKRNFMNPPIFHCNIPVRNTAIDKISNMSSFHAENGRKLWFHGMGRKTTSSELKFGNFDSNFLT